MHLSSLTGTLLPCEHCDAEFFPKRPWQRFCSRACRNAAHYGRLTNAPLGTGPVGRVRSVRRLVGGRVALTIHCSDTDAIRALRVDIDDVLRLARPA